MDPVQFSLCQKWTRSSFTSPMADPVQFSLSQKWTCLVCQKWTWFQWSFVEQKWAPHTYRSLFQIMILSYVFIVLLNSWQRSICQCRLSLTTLVTCPCQYIHTCIHMQWLFAHQCRLLYACCGNGALVSTLMLQGFLMVLIKTLNTK